MTSPQWGKRLDYGDEADVWKPRCGYVEIGGRAHLVKARKFQPHGWRILPWQGITSCLGLALVALYPGKFSSHPENSIWTFLERKVRPLRPKESTHALKREPNWRKKKMEPRRPTPRFIWGRQFGRDGRGAFERLKKTAFVFWPYQSMRGGGLERSFLSTSIVSCDGFCFAQKGSIIVPSLDLMPLREGPSIHFWLNHRWRKIGSTIVLKLFSLVVASRGVSQ